MSNPMEVTSPDSPKLASPRWRNTRAGEGTPLILEELDPRWVVDGVAVNGALMAPDVQPVGKMRETCPHCPGQPLQLVLRYGPVIRSHLFCEHCTRCFDAKFADGSSALTTAGLPIA